MSDAYLMPANGANKTKRNGSHLEPHKRDSGHRAAGSGRGGSVEQSKQNKMTRTGGSHTDPSLNVAGSRRSSERGGGDVYGHDRVSPTAGKGKSGSKNKPKIG